MHFLLELPLGVQVYHRTSNFARAEELTADLAQWRVLRDLKEAEEDLEQEHERILSHQKLMSLQDLVQTVAARC